MDVETLLFKLDLEDNFSSVFSVAREALSGFAERFGAMRESLSSLGGGASSATGEVGNLSGVMSALEPAALAAGAALAAVGVAGVAIAGVAVNLAVGFEDATVNLSNYANISEGAAKGIGNAMLEMGSKGVFSGAALVGALSPVAGRLETITGASLNTASAQQFMAQSAELAEISNSNLGSTTNTLANIMLAYKIPLGDVAKATDQLWNISRTTGQSMEEIGTIATRLKARFGVAAPSLQDVGALMVDLQSSGIVGSRGMMAVTIGMQTLLGGAPGVKKELDSLGISVYDQNGKFIGLRETIARLAPVLSTMNDQQRKAAETAIFGSSAGTLFDGVLRGGVAAFDQYSQRIGQSGSVSEAAARNAATLSDQMKLLQNAATTALTELGLKLLPPLISGFEMVKRVAPQVFEFIKQAVAAALPSLKDMKAAWDAIEPALSTTARVLGSVLLPPLRTVAEFIGRNKEIVGALILGLGIFIGVLGGVAIAFTVASAAATIFAIATAPITLPVLLIAAAIALLVVGIVLLIKNWDKIREAIGNVIGIIRDVALAVFNRLRDIVQDHIRIFALLAAVLLLPLLPFIAIGIAIYELIRNFGKLKDFVLGLPGALGAAWTAVRDAAIGAFSGVIDFFGSLPGKISGALLGGMGGIGGNWTRIWRDILTGGLYEVALLVIARWRQIRDAFVVGADAVISFLRERWPLILAVLTGPLGLTIYAIITHWTQITQLIQSGADRVLGIIRAGWDAVRNASIAAWAAIRDAIVGAVSIAIAFLVLTVRSGVDAVLNVFRQAPGQIISALSALASMLTAAAVSAMKALMEGIKQGFLTVIAFFRDMPAQILSRLTGAGGWLYDIGRQIVQGLIDGIAAMAKAALDAVKDLGGKIIGGAKSAFKMFSPSLVFHEIGVGIAEGLANGITAGAPAAQAAMGNLAKTLSAFSLAAGKAAGVQGVDNSGVMSIGQYDQAAITQLMQAMGDAGGSVSEFADVIRMTKGSYGLSLASIGKDFASMDKIAEQFGDHLVQVGANVMAMSQVALSAEQKAMADGLVATGMARDKAVEDVFQQGALIGQLQAGQISNLGFFNALPSEARTRLAQLLEAQARAAPKAHTGAYVQEGGLAELSTGETVLPPSGGGGGRSIVIDLRSSQFIDDAAIARLVERIGRELATYTLPGAGIQVAR